MDLISTTDALAAACRRLAAHPFVTVDTEFLRETTYYPKLCLIQMAGPDPADACLVDPLAEGISLDPFMALMADPNVVKVFHSARQDLEIVWNLGRLVPEPLFDTQIAAMVCGYGDSVSYEQLVNDLAQLTNGFETMLGERGVTLSGGQKQRTALARALLKAPPVLVLDDALSHVDTHTEEEILKTLQGMIPEILKYEEACRRELANRGRLKLEDKVHRALATLRVARTLSSEEAMQFLSWVRLGTVMGILSPAELGALNLATVNKLFVLTQPAHLQKMEGRTLDAGNALARAVDGLDPAAPAVEPR